MLLDYRVHEMVNIHRRFQGCSCAKRAAWSKPKYIFIHARREHTTNVLLFFFFANQVHFVEKDVCAGFKTVETVIGLFVLSPAALNGRFWDININIIPKSISSILAIQNENNKDSLNRFSHGEWAVKKGKNIHLFYLLHHLDTRRLLLCAI